MKIGVLTYFGVPNFGAQLQALSTVGYLRRSGNEPVVLNWYPDDLKSMYRERVSAAQIQAHDAFTLSELPLSEACYSEGALADLVDNECFDGIIQGSDALFKYEPERLRRHFRKRLLKFVVNPPSISVEGLQGNPFFGGYLTCLKHKIPAFVYAVSSQNCPFQLLTIRERREMRKRLKHFDGISVRDEWTREMVWHIMGRKLKVDINPDPVFSFNQNCNNIIPAKEEVLRRFDLPERYVLFSFWTSKLPQDYVSHIAEEVKVPGLTPVAFPMPEGLMDFGLEKRVQLPLSPIDWYALIKYSAGYIGERMHPIVVALHNAVPFFSFDEYGVGEQHAFRMDSSKTYLIVHRAGFDENYYAYQSQAERPMPSEVVNRIVAFDTKKCGSFSESMQIQYEKAMAEIVSRISQSGH